MKKLVLFLSVVLLLTACAPGEVVPPTCAETPVEEQPTCGPGVPCGLTCRIVDGVETGTLLLAEADNDTPGVYTLSLADEVKWKLTEPLRSGQLIFVSYHTVLETYPAQLTDISGVTILEYGFDDRCALYLRVLEDLWAVDSGLNESGVEYIGVDLAATSLSPAEQTAVAHAFASRHGAQAVTGTLEYLKEQGYITATPLSGTGSGSDLNDPKYYFHEWENGCFFAITEQEMEGVYHGLIPVTFAAHKWRSSLGAYFFSDCTAVRSASGEWSDYTIGSAMIS